MCFYLYSYYITLLSFRKAVSVMFTDSLHSRYRKSATS